MMRWFRTARNISLGAAALGLAGCAGVGGEEPLYVLRDSLGRSVAMAGQSQLGNAAPGSMVRANISGLEQDVMVGERIGMGPVMQARPAGEPMPSAPEPPALAVAAPVTESVATPARSSTRRARGTSVTETGANPSGRRRGPTSRAVSRSVM
jgi:hypothetical protein